MSVDLDVIVDADAAQPPFGELVRFARQGLERRPIESVRAIAGASRRAAGSGALR